MKILERFSAETARPTHWRFLSVGPPTPFESLLAENGGWSGVTMSVHDDRAHYQDNDRIVRIIGYIDRESRFMMRMDKRWVRTATLGDIVFQFGGKYDVLISSTGYCDREIMTSVYVNNMLPRVMVTVDDGHNKELVIRLGERGYVPCSDGEWLMMVRE